jgi:hypothetical protein
MESAYVIAFSVLFTVAFFMIGGIVGWLFFRHQIENRPPYLHPEFFDKNGNVIPDEIVSVSFNPDYFGFYDEDCDEDDEE